MLRFLPPLHLQREGERGEKSLGCCDGKFRSRRPQREKRKKQEQKSFTPLLLLPFQLEMRTCLSVRPSFLYSYQTLLFSLIFAFDFDVFSNIFFPAFYFLCGNARTGGWASELLLLLNRRFVALSL